MICIISQKLLILVHSKEVFIEQLMFKRNKLFNEKIYFYHLVIVFHRYIVSITKLFNRLNFKDNSKVKRLTEDTKIIMDKIIILENRVSIPLLKNYTSHVPECNRFCGNS